MVDLITMVVDMLVVVVAALIATGISDANVMFDTSVDVVP